MCIFMPVTGVTWELVLPIFRGLARTTIPCPDVDGPFTGIQGIDHNIVMICTDP